MSEIISTIFDSVAIGCVVRRLDAPAADGSVSGVEAEVCSTGQRR